MTEQQIDKGQELLIKHLRGILEDAERGEFGDFTNVKYPAPKMALRANLLEMAENVIQGIYD